MGNFVELKNINLTYNKNKDNAYQALFDVNLNIKQGEFVVIFGPSGCGKSSLLNVIAGLEDTDEGEVKIDGQDLLAMKEKEKVKFHCTKMGMIFQSYNLIPTLNVLNNVALPQMFNDIKKKDREIRAMEILKRFGIEQQWKKIPAELSGGQQQRIGIARAIINDPQLILADEPIGNLDTKSANNVMEILSNLNRREGKTVVLVSHNPENIVWGTHIIYMKDGKIIKEEFKEADQVREVESEEYSGKSEFDIMTEKLNGLSKEQISLMINPMKAKIIVDSLLTPYEKNQIDIIEKNIGMYLLKNIEAEQLMHNLDADTNAGGAGLDSRVAERFSKEIENITQAVYLFVEETDINKRVLIFLDYLGSKLNLKMENEQVVVKMGNLIKNKLLDKINYGRFKELLDSSKDKDGIGLDKRMSNRVAKELSLFLVVSYGVNTIETNSLKRINSRVNNGVNSETDKRRSFKL